MADTDGIPSAPPAPPMPSSLSSSSLSATRSGAPPPPPPPGMGLTPTYKELKEQSFQEQQMANLPSGLLTTAAKADKKPFSYTPVGLSAADLKSPSLIRNEKLAAGDTGTIVPGIPRGPTHYRAFNGITPPSPGIGGSASSSPAPRRRTNSTSSSVRSDDDPDMPRYKGVNGEKAAPIQSRSFKILQWMTGADQDDDSVSQSSPTPASANETDEMRFGSYNRQTSIPSRTFQAVDRMTSASPQPAGSSLYGRSASPSPYGRTPEPAEPFRTDLTEEQASNLRYGGAGIPSRSFQMLQNMTESGTVPVGNALQPNQRNSAINNSYGYQTYSIPVSQIPDPSPHDFKYQGPQYSTYELPNPRNPAANSVATKYSTSINVGSNSTAGRSFAVNHNSPYAQSATSPSPYGVTQQSGAVQPGYYGTSSFPARNVQYSQVPTGYTAGSGVSDF
ncbi:hypothetical protein RvY_11476 [Ramazzottius varieornatus]|uniref:Zasp-like motif domain-containing protein n=1 Tax=Ramazzottius varieornatus TaxID=947166 RepID=A0A1D1VG75_RAMVA|nr:hypothetical protein RvY_11476 [Ramazzottius varieornatus]